MSARQQGGIVDADRVYTHITLGETLNRAPEWIKENLIEIEGGIFAKKIGHTYYIAGAVFLAWIENNSEPWKPERKRRNAQAVGGKAAGA